MDNIRTYKDLGHLLIKGLPLIGSLLCGSLGATIGALIANTLECDNTPEAIYDKYFSSNTGILRLAELEKSQEVYALLDDNERVC